MDPEECARVAIREFDGGVHGDHVGGYSGGIRTSLDSEMVEFDGLDVDSGLHGSASGPENEREEGEEKEEGEKEGEEIVSASEGAVAVLGLDLEKSLFFDDVDVLPRFVMGAVVVVVDFARSGEAAGGGVGVGRGTHGAEDGGGVQGRRRFLPIVGGALHVVHCSPRGPRARRRVQARHLRVCLRMHFNQYDDLLLLPTLILSLIKTKHFCFH